ncbi:MAG TPA: hypothetical protein VF911_21785 [Thermoanaerobaculia bacterium]
MNTWLQTLATNRDIPGWEDTAMNWLVAAIVMAIIVTLGMIFWKSVTKRTAAGPVGLTWSRRRTILFVLTGLVPLAMLVSLVWYSSINFQSVAGVPGLLKGILLAWALYSICMVVAHAGLWRDDLFNRQETR